MQWCVLLILSVLTPNSFTDAWGVIVCGWYSLMIGAECYDFGCFFPHSRSHTRYLAAVVDFLVTVADKYFALVLQQAHLAHALLQAYLSQRRSTAVDHWRIRQFQRPRAWGGSPVEVPEMCFFCHTRASLLVPVCRCFWRTRITAVESRPCVAPRYCTCWFIALGFCRARSRMLRVWCAFACPGTKVIRLLKCPGSAASGCNPPGRGRDT